MENALRSVDCARDTTVSEGKALLRHPSNLLFFFLLTLLLSLSGHLLQDPDTFWHISVGEYIWRKGAFPTVDEFSHTFEGKPWIAKEWLSQAILYGAYTIGGWSGITLVTATTIAASFSAMFAWLARRIRTTVAIELVAIAVLLSSGHFVARPHVFVFPLLMLWIGGLLQARERNAPPPLWLIPTLALWANLHASFTIAFVLAALVGLEAIASEPASERVRTTTGWATFGVAALVSTGATPYGFEPLFITYKLFGSNEAVHFITEWQPLGFSFMGFLGATALLLSAGMLLAAPRENCFRLLIILVCGYLMMRYGRFASLFAITAAMVSVGPIVRRFPQLRADIARPTGWLKSLSSCALIALPGVCVALVAFAHPSPVARIMPSAALEAARRAGVAGPVFNEYDFGGYLISQGVKTFIDGRSDQLFINGFFSSLRQAENSSDPAKINSLLNVYNVGWALLRPKSHAAEKLNALSEWTNLYEDEVAVVFVRNPQERLGTAKQL